MSRPFWKAKPSGSGTDIYNNTTDLKMKMPDGVLAPTFVRSNALKEYQNSVLVGAFHNGAIYDLKLNDNLTEFVFQNQSLADLVLYKADDPPTIMFASGFAGITDIKEGPDGLIYVGWFICFKVKSKFYPFF
jgi:hypothetical protein